MMILFLNKRVRFSIIVLFSIMFASTAVMSESKDRDFYSIGWNEQITKFALPKPFNDVSIRINKTGEILESIVLVTNGKEVRFQEKLLTDIENISNPEFSYDKADFDKDKKIDSFVIYFEYGDPRLIELGDVPGCKSPCMESVRDIVVFTVDKDYHVSREFKSLKLD